MKSWRTKLDGAQFTVIRMRETATEPERSLLDTPERIHAHLKRELSNNPTFNPDVENFFVVLLNTRLRIISWQMVSQGILDKLLVHPREVFKPAIILSASAIVIAHNHPSGDPTPSETDIKVTRDLIRAGKILKIELLDHIVFGMPELADKKPYASLRELGYFYT